jgi:DNA-binding GntR family transcriptional regulator
LIAWLYRKLNEIRAHAQWDAMKRSILNPASIEKYNREHRGIYQALVNRDAEAATQMITEHLEHARRDLIAARPD